MGVIYKLKPETKDLILEEKKANPMLSCRGLAVLFEQKFQIKLSKSSINFIIKEAGLSMPLGRRPKRRKQRVEILPKPATEVTSEIPAETKAKEQIEPVVEKLVQGPVEVKADTRVEPPPETSVPVEPKAEEQIEPVVEKLVKEAIKAQAEIGAETPSQVILPGEIPTETSCTGVILLKAADYLLGGSYLIAQVISNRLKIHILEVLPKIESLLYLPLFSQSEQAPLEPDCGLWTLINRRFPAESIHSYLNELQENQSLSMDIFRIVSNVFQEVRCIKVDLSDGGTFYLDGQLHTLWSTPHIPGDLSTTIYNIKSCINKYFRQDRPFILFMVPGYDMPTKELFDFMLGLNSLEKKLQKFTLYGNRLEEIEIIPLDRDKKRFFVFGLWPWQFGRYRQVKLKGGFRPLRLELSRKEIYIAEAEVELSQPNVDKRVTLRGCALKTNPDDKIRLILLTNLYAQETKLEDVARIYLDNWPNLEECFEDLGRKIELFTYTASSQRFFATDNLNINKEPNPDIRALFNYYLKALDFYVMWHFLPLGYEDKDFSTINEHFYSLNTKLKREKNHILATFQPPSGYLFLNDLEYACRRVNEREIYSSEGKRLWLSIV